MSENLLFHRPLEPPVPPDPDSQTRRFEGDGTAYLMVPGLEELRGVKIGFMDLPLFEEIEIPTQIAGAMIKTTVINCPVVERQTSHDGTPYLMRAKFSNDGIWQPGPVWITGRWSDEETPEAAAANAAAQAQEAKREKGLRFLQGAATKEPAKAGK